MSELKRSYEISLPSRSRRKYWAYKIGGYAAMMGAGWLFFDLVAHLADRTTARLLFGSVALAILGLWLFALEMKNE